MQRQEARNEKQEIRRYVFYGLLSVLLLLVFCFLPLASDAEAAKPRLSTIIAEGIAAVIEEDQIKAREIAIKNAMRNAVENVVADFIKESEELEMYRESLEENIYKNCEDFIQSYKILGDMQDNDIYSITLQLNIFEDSIKKRLLSLGIRPANLTTRILLIIEEKTGHSFTEDNFLTLFSISEEVISEKLKETGFEVIDRGTARNKIDIKELRKALSGGGIHSISVLGSNFNTDLVILGNTNMRTETGRVQAEVNIKVYSVKKEALLLEKNEITTILTTDKVSGTAQSLRTAAEKIASDLVDYLKKEWNRENKSSGSIQ